MAKGRKTGGRNFQPGKSGNPAGAQPLPDDIRELRATQPYEVAKIINKVMWMTRAQTQALLGTQEHPNNETPNIERAIAMCTMKCINEGCVTRLNALSDRWLGRVKEVVMFVPASIPDDEQTNPQLSGKPNGLELVQLYRRAQPACPSPGTKKSTTKRGRS